MPQGLQQSFNANTIFAQQGLQQSFNANNYNLEIKNDFDYLESTLNKDNNVSSEFKDTFQEKIVLEPDNFGLHKDINFTCPITYQYLFAKTYKTVTFNVTKVGKNS